MTTIITGFTPFPGVDTNPTQQVIETLREADLADVVAEVLPVAFGAAGDRIRSLIREYRPGAVIMLGVAAGRPAINLERFALNISDATHPDNHGALANGVVIVADGPTAYRATLPLTAIFEALDEREIPVVFSNHAGAYVCNHVFYSACHEIDQLELPTLCGFIHVPALPGTVVENGNGTVTVDGMMLPLLVEAAHCALSVVQIAAVS